MKKKNLRKIPKTILNQIERRLKDEKNLIAACLRTYSRADIENGILKHLNVTFNSGQLSTPLDSVIPTATNGKYSKRNIYGYEDVRKDLPKETHYNEIEAPNWGDDYNGTHTVSLPYKKYPRDFHAPRLRRITIESKDAGLSSDEYILIFQIDQVLDRDSGTFQNDLLECLNILQENIGTCGVQKSGASMSDYLATVNLSWEVLPPGTKEESIERIFGSRRSISEEDKNTAGERYDFFMKLKPRNLVYGASGLQRYFGALITDDLVVFENVEYGNAIYIMFEEWKELSKKTRTELLSGRFGNNFERILHIDDWQAKVEQIVEEYKKQYV